MHIYDLFRWILALAFGLLGWCIIIVNFMIVYRWYTRREHHSMVPLAGGFLALFGMLACPLPQVERFALVPLMIDTGFQLLLLIIGLAGLVLKLFAKGKRDDAN